MNKNIIVFSLIALLLSACGPTEEQQAQKLVNDSRNLVINGQWREARFLLDSIHNTYPRLVAYRRQAKSLEDSIVYLESKKNIAYADSLLSPLLPKADLLLKQFKYDKNDKYENQGNYVHRLLVTSSNTSRNFLQSCVRDDRETVVKSYYFGTRKIQQKEVILSANGEELHFSGSSHSFEAEGWHSIMTFSGEQALSLLNFVNSHINHRIRIEGRGQNANENWVYNLSNQEKSALSATYELGWLMKDIKRLEQMLNTSHQLVNRYEQKYITNTNLPE